MEYFEKIGALIENQWIAADCLEETFPVIAHRVLLEFPPNEAVSFWDVTKWGIMAERLPPQLNMGESFGQPPLTVYRGRNFCIDVLYWLEGVPHVHQHSFSGAFHVLRGSSLHSVWSFSKKRKISSRLLLGQMLHRDTELLRTGETRIIRSGDQLIHSTFHLERPTLSVVVRTISEVDKLPQYSFLPPAIAHDASYEAPIVRRKIQLLRMLLNVGEKAKFFEAVQELFAKEDAISVLQMVLNTHLLLSNGSEGERLLQLMSTRNAPLARALKPALDHARRSRAIQETRRRVTRSDLQFFLALMLNLPDRASILPIVQKYSPGADPTDRVISWIRDLSTSGSLGFAVREDELLAMGRLLRDSLSKAAFGHDGGELNGHSTDFSAETKNSWFFHALFSHPTALQDDFAVDTVAE